jgi:OpgC protein
MRAANEIDFWRGLALASIFINHIPGFYFERFTHRNFGQSDSAELFVFLAGWALRLVVSSRSDPLSSTRLVLRLGARALTIYMAQILITTLAIAIIAAASMVFDNPLILEWNNAAAAFQDPVPTDVGIMLLTHQLGAFNILPLYVVLMLAAPAIAIVHRATPHALLAGRTCQPKRLTRARRPRPPRRSWRSRHSRCARQHFLNAKAAVVQEEAHVPFGRRRSQFGAAPAGLPAGEGRGRPNAAQAALPNPTSA